MAGWLLLWLRADPDAWVPCGLSVGCWQWELGGIPDPLDMVGGHQPHSCGMAAGLSVLRPGWGKWYVTPQKPSVWNVSVLRLQQKSVVSLWSTYESIRTRVGIQTLPSDTGGVGMAAGRAGVWLEMENVPRIRGGREENEGWYQLLALEKMSSQAVWGTLGTLGARLAAASRALALIRAAQAIGDLCLPKLFQMWSVLQ